MSVAVRLGGYPDLDPLDADDGIMCSLSFALVCREWYTPEMSMLFAWPAQVPIQVDVVFPVPEQ